MTLIDVFLYVVTVFIIVAICCCLLDFHFGNIHQWVSKNTARKKMLLAKAADRLDEKSIQIEPPLIEPVLYRLSDGLVIRLLDGDMHWLTWRERFLIFIRVYDAWSIESELDFKRHSRMMGVKHA